MINSEIKKIAFVGNSSQTMCNFRMSVMIALVKEGYEVVMLAPKDSSITELKQNKIRFIPIEINCKGMNPIEDLHLTRALTKIYKKEHFDIVFHYTIKPIIFGGWAAALAGIPQTSVVTGLGYTFLRKGWINTLSKLLYRSSLRSANEVWFLNQEDKTLFVTQGIVLARKARLIPGEGVNLERFCPQKQDVTNAPFRFLFIGRVLWDKGVGEFVEAAKVIKQQLPKVKFQILGALGASNPASVGQEQMDQWKQQGAICYLGETNNVIPYISSASCIVLPSYREGVSRVLLEAAAMEKPIITSNVPGCRDVVVHGENGYLCEPKSVSSLVTCMMHILSLNEKELHTMGCKGRQLVSKKYSEDTIIKIYLEHIHEFILDKC